MRTRPEVTRAAMPPSAVLSIHANTASELMTPDPLSIRAAAPIWEAAEMITDRGFSAVPVVDDAGKPVGVLSRTDIVRHDYAPAETSDRSPVVRDIMTPMVFAVTPGDPVGTVVQKMVDLNIRRLFVIDGAGTLVGVVSAIDVVRNLAPA